MAELVAAGEHNPGIVKTIGARLQIRFLGVTAVAADDRD
jgi:hypothetical protein